MPWPSGYVLRPGMSSLSTSCFSLPYHLHLTCVKFVRTSGAFPTTVAGQVPSRPVVYPSLPNEDGFLH